MSKMNINFILGLYKKYCYNLKKVRKYQRKLYCQKGYCWIEMSLIFRAMQYILKKLCSNSPPQNIMRINPQLDDIEAEITYLLIREFKPNTVVEISPCGGWSTSWILHAIKDNGFGQLYSYDIVDYSKKLVPRELFENRWSFIKGDIKKNIDKLPQKINYLFIDSDHSADFAQWYIQNIFPYLLNGTPISIHDIYRVAPSFSSVDEASIITTWLKQKNIEYFTASPAKEKAVFHTIMSIKNKLNIKRQIHFHHFNSMIFFFKK